MNKPKILIEKYKYKIEIEDFVFIEINTSQKGSRKKRIIIDFNKESNRVGHFKYEKYNCSESCSEKLSFEIAKILGFPCAEIELAKDKEGNIGIISYLFLKDISETHTDAKDFFYKDNFKRQEFCTISAIKKFLDSKGKGLFKHFLRIMVFDALVGETDRHEENWGLTRNNDKYVISPLYDNGCNLLREFKNIELAEKYYNKIKIFDNYINNSSTLIFKENSKNRYKHFELIKELYKNYPETIAEYIKSLNELDDNTIKNIVNKIPDEMLSELHRKYIIEYIIKRRDILLNIKDEERQTK